MCLVKNYEFRQITPIVHRVHPISSRVQMIDSNRDLTWFLWMRKASMQKVFVFFVCIPISHVIFRQSSSLWLASTCTSWWHTRLKPSLWFFHPTGWAVLLVLLETLEKIPRRVYILHILLGLCLLSPCLLEHTYLFLSWLVSFIIEGSTCHVSYFRNETRFDWWVMYDPHATEKQSPR